MAIATWRLLDDMAIATWRLLDDTVTNFQRTDRPFDASRLPERSQKRLPNGGLLERRSPDSSRS